MLKKEITLFGFKVQIMQFGKAQFFYPTFNGNAEFKVSKKGFKELTHYLRSVNYHDRLLESVGLPKVKQSINIFQSMGFDIVPIF